MNSVWRSPRKTKLSLYKKSLTPSSTSLALNIHFKGTGGLLTSLEMYDHVNLLIRALCSLLISAARSSDLQVESKHLGTGGPSLVPNNVLCVIRREVSSNFDFVSIKLLIFNQSKNYWSAFSIYSTSSLSSSSILCWREIPLRCAETDGNGDFLFWSNSTRHIRRIVWVFGVYTLINHLLPSISMNCAVCGFRYRKHLLCFDFYRLIDECKCLSSPLPNRL